MNILFVTWDGPQVSYLEGLFLPIFDRLSREGWKFHVLQFTWGERQYRRRNKEACLDVGIPYRSVDVWRRPVSISSFLSAFKGARDIRHAISDWDIDVVMPRSTLPVFATMRALNGTKVPMIFDADGLPLDERVDFGNMSPVSKVYRFLRDVEAQGVRRASLVLTRTDKAAEILLARAGAGFSGSRFHRVENGRDANHFTLREAKERCVIRSGLDVDQNAPLLVYVGSLGEQYCLPEMLTLFLMILQRRPESRFLILTGSPDLARSMILEHVNLLDKVIIRSVSPVEVPSYLVCADLGMGLRRFTFSMQGVAPIKLGEYLLCGVPVLATDGVGDTSKISSDIGRLVKEMDSKSLKDIADWFVNDVLSDREQFRVRCRRIGVEFYSLESSVQSYVKALEGLCK